MFRYIRMKKGTMMNLIQTELTESEQFDFDHIEGTDLVKLNRRNVLLAEAMIRNNSRYSGFRQKPSSNSSRDWFDKLSSFFKTYQPTDNPAYKETMKKYCRAINKENSTRLPSEYLDRLIEKIIEIDPETLSQYLRDPKDNKHNQERPYELIKLLSENVADNGKYCCRSFASKFCHYTCFYLFDGLEEQDNYSNYDSVVRKTLPKYIKHFQLKKRSQKSLENYAVYQECIDEIISHADDEISRNGFDHLIWYYYKNKEI